MWQIPYETLRSLVTGNQAQAILVSIWMPGQVPPASLDKQEAMEMCAWIYMRLAKPNTRQVLVPILWQCLWTKSLVFNQYQRVDLMGQTCSGIYHYQPNMGTLFTFKIAQGLMR